MNQEPSKKTKQNRVDSVVVEILKLKQEKVKNYRTEMKYLLLNYLVAMGSLWFSCTAVGCQNRIT